MPIYYPVTDLILLLVTYHLYTIESMKKGISSIDLKIIAHVFIYENLSCY